MLGRVSEAAKNEQMVRIEMDGASIEALIRSASIEELRSDSTELERRQSLSGANRSLAAPPRSTPSVAWATVKGRVLSGTCFANWTVPSY